MNLEQSVASMTDEQIAESFDIMSRCNYGFCDDDDNLTERGMFAIDVAKLVRKHPCERPAGEATTTLKRMAKEIENLPQWTGRRLVFERAISIIGAAP